MALDKIIERIKKDVEHKTDTIYEREEEKAQEIREEIEREKKRKLNEIRKDKKREIKTLKNRILSQAKLEKRKKKLEVREEMIEKVFDEVMERVKAMDPSDYEDYLRKAIGRCDSTLKGDITILCNKDSKDKVKELARKIDPSLEVKAELDSLGGIKARSEEGSSIDLTFEANIERKKKELRKEIANILFPEE